MEKIGNLLNQAERSKSLTTTAPLPPQWGGLLLTIAQTRRYELTSTEIKLWQAKLSAYPNDLVEWALLNYNGEFFPNPSTICRMIEVKREAMFTEHQNREWKAYKANQKQAEQEGQMATQEQYDELREKFRKIAFGPPLVPMKPIKGVLGGKSGQEAVAGQLDANSRPGAGGPGDVTDEAGHKSGLDTATQSAQADV